MVVFISCHGVQGLIDTDDSTEDDSWSYFVITPKPEIIRNLHKKILQDGPSIQSLIVENPSIQILMEKARRRSQKLEMRLLQWTDYLSSLSSIEMQMQQYVDHHENLEPETLLNYAEWCVSLDSGATKGVMEKIHNLIVPMFRNQGLIQLLQSFLAQFRVLHWQHYDLGPRNISGCTSAAMSVRRVRSFLVVLALATTTRAISVDDVVDIISLGKEIGQEVISSWDVIGKPFNVSEGVAIPYVHRKEREILEKLGQVSRAIERLEVSVQSIGQLAVMISKKGHRATRTELLLHEMSVLLSKVSSSNSKMREYVDIQTGLERSTLEDFASRCVSHDSGALPGLLERIHSIVVPPHKNLLGQGLFQILVDHFKVCY
ncbi:unnamed protein product [Arctia plantaginis]|uniref:Uncharacterized protein n=1 Tax=Arctia plantaginis TaxID=874455 RepID=A0A8S0ZSX3_ARCPL|nr:unnamed protein product [Arctia plantaginis]